MSNREIKRDRERERDGKCVDCREIERGKECVLKKREGVCVEVERRCVER